MILCLIRAGLLFWCISRHHWRELRGALVKSRGEMVQVGSDDRKEDGQQCFPETGLVDGESGERKPWMQASCFLSSIRIDRVKTRRLGGHRDWLYVCYFSVRWRRNDWKPFSRLSTVTAGKKTQSRIALIKYDHPRFRQQPWMIQQ